MPVKITEVLTAGTQMLQYLKNLPDDVVVSTHEICEELGISRSAHCISHPGELEQYSYKVKTGHGITRYWGTKKAIAILKRQCGEDKA